ncbi:VCBS repeat-containing protein [Bradyrhizobium sp. BR 10289]|uniref:FG-GAP repeat domain-containing protein n=1 Tax=Bradyrhizobium sp. BR 10289 TaxID=2749993 RepID=UPI001C64C90A|nr:VCBS repeat-containing protein [Bradyrhizobium sp. BR 10289]MBW7970285.1 hypothetical protein [Bradyrhizobium sp. BR 10289]
MTSVTYSYSSIGGSIFDNSITGGDQSGVALAALANGNFLVTWDGPDVDYVQGRILSPTNNPITSEFSVNSTQPNHQYHSSVAGLSNGNAIAVFVDTSSDPNGDIRARLFASDGTPLGSDFLISGGANMDGVPNVAALPGGGYVVTWTRTFGSGGDEDIKAAIFNSAGTAIDTFTVSSSSATLDSFSSHTTALADGSFVVTWSEKTAGGNGNVSNYFRRFDALGATLDSGPVLIDNAGTNSDIHVVALADGGFAVTYTDTGWAANTTGGTSITARVFNADGSVRSDFIQVNPGSLAGSSYFEIAPSITTLPNGGFTVGWADQSSGTEFFQAFDSLGHRLGDYQSMVSNVYAGELTTTVGGHVVLARTSSLSDGDGSSSIRSSTYDLIKQTTGDATNEVIVGEKGIIDKVTAGGGNDTFVYGKGGGADVWTDFVAGAGSADKIDLTSFGRHLHLGNILSQTTQNGSDATIDFGGGDTVTLQNVNKSDLHADDFIGLKSTSNDFGGNGTSDLLWRSDTGAVVSWSMNNHTYAGVSLGTVDNSWKISDTGDIDNDGRQDLLWRDNSGELVVWRMNGSTYTGIDLGHVDTSFAIVGTGDFDTNGTSDILFRNTTTGNLISWDMFGSNHVGFDFGVVSNTYAVVGTADIDGNGSSDILFRDNSGQLVGWFMADHVHAGFDFGRVDTTWQLAGTGDFDGNGTDDLLWRNSGNGDLVMWNMAGTSHTSFDLGIVATNFQIASVGDINADGKSDIIWRNSADGDVTVWNMDNHVHTGFDFGVVSQSYHLMA